MTFDDVLKLLGILVPFLSAVSSFLNHMVRQKQAAGDAVSPMLAGAGSVLNVGALNIDKAIQLAKLIKEMQAPKAGATPTDAPPAA